MSKFKAYKYFDDTKFRIVNKTLEIYVGTLVVPIELEDINKTFKKISSRREEQGMPLVIEYCFPRAIVNTAIESNVLELRDRYSNAEDGELDLKINLSEHYRKALPSDVHYFAQKIEEPSKMRFAEWITKKDADAFVALRPTLDQIRRIVMAN